MRPSCFLPSLALTILLVLPAIAATSEWKESGGKSFKGEPADLLGPYAIFRTGHTSGRVVQLNTLTPEDCVRFHRELAAAQPRDADGKTTRGRIATELKGCTLRQRSGQFTPVDTSKGPEPSVFVLISLSPQDGSALSRIVNALFLQYQRIQKIYPGQFEAIYYSRARDSAQFLNIARSQRMPWLVADPKKIDQLKTFERIAPFDGNFVVALSRNGTPILSANGQDEEALTLFMDQLAGILGLIQPDNMRNWRARYHYLSAVRPVEFADSSSGSLMLGHPLKSDVLRKFGIAEIKAKFDVAESGKIQKVSLARTQGVDEKSGAALAEALRRAAVILPAIEKGKPVASSFVYTYVVPKEDPERDAIFQWIHLDPTREYPIKDWLVLKTFKVEQQGFLEVSHVTEDGVTVFKPVKALQGRAKEEADLKSQKTAFAYDWFSAEECANIRPREGMKQMIDGAEYVWQRFKPYGRSVELNTGWEKEQYCYCYAWTEIDVDQDQPALLGLGSDDGVKVWLNGNVLVENWAKRPLRIDEDIIPLRLKKGKNQLLLKVQNIYGEWRYSCRIILQGPVQRPPAAHAAK